MATFPAALLDGNPLRPFTGPSTLERAVGEERFARKWTTANEWCLGVKVASTHRQESGQSTTAKCCSSPKEC